MGKRSKNRQELEVQDRHRFESKEANNEKLIKAHEKKVSIKPNTKPKQT